MSTADRKLRVFLCYASEDKRIIERFYGRFTTTKWIEPWFDEEAIFPGMNREVEVERALENADVVIVFLSHNSVTKEGHVQRELKLVLDAAIEKPEGSIFLIPIRLDECPVPRGMRHLKSIDFSLPENREKALNLLMRSLEIQADVMNKRSGKTRSAHFVSPQHFQTEPEAPPLAFSGFNFVRISKGKFIIGSKTSNPFALENEFPQSRCNIPYDYWITRFPVSNDQFSEFAISTKHGTALPKDWRAKLNHPVVNVSWHDAISYTSWLNEVFGKEISGELVFRLPTEAEWERASRGDSASEWPWGKESLDELLEKEIYSGIPDMFRPLSSQSMGDHKREYQEMRKKIDVLRCTLDLTDVGSFSPLTDSPFKVADMMGSIIEWTQSLYAPYPYDALDGREDLESEENRVIRGCFTSNKERFCVRSARRAYASPDKKEAVLGFRIVVAPPVL